MQKPKFPPKTAQALKMSRLLYRQGKRRMERKKERARSAGKPKKSAISYIGSA